MQIFSTKLEKTTTAAMKPGISSELIIIASCVCHTSIAHTTVRTGFDVVSRRKYGPHMISCTAPTRQHEPDHTDHTNHTYHTDQKAICSGRSGSRIVGTDDLKMICSTCEPLPPYTEKKSVRSLGTGARSFFSAPMFPERQYRATS